MAVYGLSTTGTPRIAAVVSSGSYGSAAAPGSIISIFGTNFTASPGQASAYPLPVSLGGVSVMVGGKTAPLYYAGPSQINAQVPVDAPLGAVPVVVTTPAGPTASVNLTVKAAAPAILVIVNANGSVNTAAQSAAPGAAVTVYLTGIGAVKNTPATGAPASGTGSTATQAVTVTVGSAAAGVSFAGAAPGYAGLDQININVPPGLSSGTYPLVVTVGGAASNPVQIAIGH